MLQLEAVSPELLRTLRALMADPAFGDFFLAEGTALALRFGHRRSIDIDLFRPTAFNAAALAEHLDKTYAASGIRTSENSVSAGFGTIKLDCLAHRYPALRRIDQYDDIRFASLADSSAMKLNAISNRGSKKDFWDVDCLLNHFPFPEMLDLFERKYPAANRWNVEKSLLYFDDAEAEPEPMDLVGRTWTEIKDRIRRELLS